MRYMESKKYSSGFTQCRLDYIYISNTLRELVTTTEILTLSQLIILLYSSVFQKEKTVSEVKHVGNLITP